MTKRVRSAVANAAATSVSAIVTPPRRGMTTFNAPMAFCCGEM
jgi:hypothetical protein